MEWDSDGQSIGRRYLILDKLGEGGMGTVHRVKDRLDGTVALKRLAAASDRFAGAPHERHGSAVLVSPVPTAGGRYTNVSPDAATMFSAPEPVAAGTATTLFRFPTRIAAPSTVAEPPSIDDERASQMAEVLRLTLAREFRVLSSLRHPNIISVLDYGFDDHLHPYFTMELLEGARSIMTAGFDLPIEGKIDLLVQMLQALAYLHRRGVIHRDLKPGNVMVVDGRVKVLDFGVSTLRERDTEGGRLIVGTLAYMAPELLTGAPASEASDLYAVGVIAYELLAGRHPFDLRSVGALRDDIVRSEPDLTPIDDRFRPVIRWLLDKRPRDRPRSVDQVFTALSTATGEELTVETAATRESFLQAAELVGRDEELAQLAGMLTDALDRRGSSALVGGESGVGKSRLLDELRVHALVEGAVVLRGQAVSEGGGPYHVFRDVLRGMVLSIDLTDLEAGVLAAIVPDIAELLGRVVPSRPEIDLEAAQTRLLAVVEEVIRRQSAPVVMILEDVHWAGSESLRLLARVLPIARDLPLLIVASYRDDERADLPSLLSAMRVIKLQRLRAESIAALAASMLGDGGRRPDLVSLLERETEGNPFFLVEVVRALAEDVGALSRVGAAPLPSRLFASGMNRVVDRRLLQVPEPAQPLLELAAVIGRQIDPALLAHLEPETDLQMWLESCADVAVLDLQAGVWRFAHDKLREGLLAALTPEDKQASHRRVAEAIEAVYPDIEEHTAALAHHWAAAGVAAKEARYCGLAGEQALRSSAYSEAVAFFERAVKLLAGTESGRSASPSGGRVQEILAAVRTASSVGHEIVDPGSDRFRMGRWEGRLAEAYGRMWNHAEAFKHGVQALAYLGHPLPSERAALIAGLPIHAALRGLQTIAPSRFAAAGGEAREVLLEATRIHARVTETCFYTQEALPMFWSGLHMLNLGEPAGPSADLAIGYSLMAAVAGIIPVHAMAEAWSKRAIELVESVGKPYDIAFVLQRVSSYRLWMARWKITEEGFEREVELANRVGDRRLLSDAKTCLGMAAMFQGRFARAEEMFAELNAWVLRHGDSASLSAMRLFEVNTKLRLGKIDEAVRLCGEVQTAVDASKVSHDILRCYGLMALGHLALGDARYARRMADKALPQMLATRPVAYWIQDGTAALAEVYLALWEASLDGPAHDRDELAKLAKQACKGVRTFAGVFAIGLPFALVWQGLEEHLSGKPAKAQRTWARAIDEAERLGMPYERGRAHLEIGRHLGRGDPGRRRHLAQAMELFAKLGTERDRERAAAELARP